MPGVTRAHGYTAAIETVGRNLLVKTFAKSNMTQAETDALVQYIQQYATVEVIGSFEAGVTDTLYMILSGAESSVFTSGNTISAGGATFTIGDATGFDQ